MSLKINFYCNEKYQNMLPEPIAASKCFPKWFSDLHLTKNKGYRVNPNNENQILDNPEKNVKRCLGIQEFLSSGYIIKSWADFIFREKEDGSLYINWMENYFDEMEYKPHGDQQFYTMPNKPIYGHFGKIHTPWIVKTDPGVSCLITHPVWHRNNLFTTTSSIIHTDVTPLKIPWFFEWNYKIQTKMSDIDTEKQIVASGEPIALIVPFYRKTFSSKINYISEEKIRNMVKSQHYITHTTENGNCPYKNFKKNLGKLFS
jgi:hypothetical protein